MTTIYHKKLNVNVILNKLILVFTALLFASFIIFTTDSWGKYVVIVLAGFIYLLAILANNGKLFIKFGAYQFLFLAFTMYAAASSIWAINSSDALVATGTLIQLLICGSLVYWHYVKQGDIYGLLTAIKWSGIIVGVYTLVVYGVQEVVQAAITNRLGLEFANVNTIGMACALSCVIQVFEWIFFRKIHLFEVVLIVPLILVVAATQSRKAIVYVIAGILLLVFFKNIDRKDFLKNIFKLIFSLLLIGLIFVALLQLEIFDGVKERLTGMFNSFFGAGEVDASTQIRNDMLALGFHLWGKNPLIGYGISNVHILANEYMGEDTYLHNNYVELLCGGGLVGFCLYYAMHVYLFVGFIKYRKANKALFSICMTWLVLTIIMDWGMVSYLMKSNSCYLMAMFVAVECLKKKHWEMKNEAVEVFESRRQVSYGSKVSF